MATTLRFNDENGKPVVGTALKQQRVIPVGQLLYTDSHSLPTALSSNALLFTTDTRELYIGTGNGIKRVNLGNDGKIVDKTDYLTKDEAAQFYVQKENLDTDEVVTQKNLEEYFKPFADTLDDLVKESNFTLNSDNAYTKEEANKQFIDNQEFDLMLSKKVDQEVLTNVGNHSYIHNLSTGVTLKFQNLGNDTEGYLNVGKNGINLYVKDTKGELFGGRLYVTPKGIFYTHTNDEDYSSNDEVMTYKDMISVQDLTEQIRAEMAENRQLAMRAQESARQSELMVEQMVSNTTSANDQAAFAVETAQRAFDIADQMQKQLNDAYVDAQSAVQQAQEALDTAEGAKNESADALLYVHRFETSVVSQLNQIMKDINDLKGGTPSTPTETPKYKISAVQNFDDIYTVPYHTEGSELALPTTIQVTLESPYEAEGTIQETIPVEWLVDRFQAYQTNYSQQIIGVPVETSTIINPNYLFAVYTVKVLEEEEYVSPDPYKWSVVFVVPHMVDTIENFSTIIGHEELSSSDLMGDLDSRNNYVEPTCELYLLGTLNEISDANKCFVLTDNEKQSKLNRSILDITEDGFKVPIMGIASDEELANYDTLTLTRAMVLSNGGYQYTEGTLLFEHSVDANNVYLIRKKN